MELMIRLSAAQTAVGFGFEHERARKRLSLSLALRATYPNCHAGFATAGVRRRRRLAGGWPDRVGRFLERPALKGTKRRASVLCQPRIASLTACYRNVANARSLTRVIEHLRRRRGARLFRATLATGAVKLVTPRIRTWCAAPQRSERENALAAGVVPYAAMSEPMHVLLTQSLSQAQSGRRGRGPRTLTSVARIQPPGAQWLQHLRGPEIISPCAETGPPRRSSSSTADLHTQGSSASASST
jgi:hypothetical protein